MRTTPVKKIDSFWRRLSRSLRGRSAASAQAHRFRPQLERLEPRLTPSANDTLTTALTPNAYGSATNGTLSDPNQVNLYVLSGIKAGDQITADLNASNGVGQPGDALRVFDGAGKQLAFQENQPGADTMLTFNATAAGTYYIGVSSNGDYTYKATVSGSGSGGLADGAYSLTLTAGTFGVPESPSNFSLATAQNISTSNQTLPGQIVVTGTYAIGRTAYYRFTAQDTGGLDLTVTPAGGSTSRTKLALYDNQGQLLIQSDAAAGAPAQLNQNLQPGTYYLGVSAAKNSGDPSYVLAAAFQPSARPYRPVAVGLGPDGAATGDFSHDGNTDLVVANYADSNNTVSVLLSNGDGTFQPQAAYTVTDANGNGIGPASVAVGDFNNDGNLDIVTADYSDGFVSVLLGNGDGTFQNPVTYAVGNNPISVAVGDFNHDGIADLVVASQNYDATTNTYRSGTVSVLLGNGDGTFQTAASYDVGAGPDAVATAVINGRYDIVTANAGDNTVSVLQGNPDGTFQKAVSYQVGNIPESVAMGDFNGLVGIVAANFSDGTVSVLLGNDDGTFKKAVAYTVGTDPQSVTVGEFNGHADIVTANNYSNTVSVLLGVGDGTFTNAVNYAVGYQPDAVTVGDFNHDNRPDIAVANYQDGSVSVLSGRGDGTFISAQTDSPVGETPFGLATADFNRDGDVDLVTANGGDKSVSVLLGNGDGTFQPARSNAVGNNPVSVAVGDFNHDGNPDLVVADYLDNQVSVLLGLGDGTFRPAVPYDVGLNPRGVAVGDFNGDGNLDIATANYGADTVSILLGNSDGTFQKAVEYKAGSNPFAIAVGVIDGHVSIVTANPGDSTVSVLLGNGRGLFQSFVSYSVKDANGKGIAPQAVALADLRNDGNMDIVTPNDDGTVSVLLGDPDGKFQQAVSFAVGSHPNAVTVGRFTNAGNLDVVTVDYGANTASVLLGRGDGTFQPALAENVGDTPHGVALGDFNNDGNLDIAAADIGDNTVSVLLGSGRVPFQSPATYPTKSAPGAVAVYSDLSGNDVIVTANPGQNDVSVLQGDPNGANFQPAKAYNTGDDPVALATGIDTAGNTDLFVANGGKDSTVSVLLGDSFNVFGAPTSYSVTDASGNGVGAVSVAESYDSSGNDFVATADSDGYVSVLVGSPDGTAFGPATTYKVGSDPVAVALAFDSNYNVDVFVADYTDGTVTVLLGDASDNFTLGGVYQLDPGLNALAVGYDSQGNDILAVTNALKNTVSVLVGDPDAKSFVTAGTYRVGKHPDAVAIGQDSNNNPNVVVANYLDGTASVLLGDANDHFQPATSYRVGPNPIGLGLAKDANGNGNLDFVTANAGNNTVSVLMGNTPFRRSTPQNGVAIRHVPLQQDLTGARDANGNPIPDELILDGSGHLLFRQGGAPPVIINHGAPARDVTLFQTADGAWAIAAVDARDNAVTLYTWDAAKGGFDSSPGFITGDLPVRIAAADLTGSGRLGDLVVANALGDSVTIALSGNFASPITRMVGSAPSDVAFVQLGGTSGRPDIVVSDQASGDFSLLFNDETSSTPPTFSRQSRYRAGAGLFDIDAGAGRQTVLSQLLTIGILSGDFIARGSHDLVVLNRGAESFTLLPYQGHGNFGNPLPSNTYITSAQPGQMALITLPGDARPSLAVLMLDRHQIWIYRNNGDGTFAAPMKIDAGNYPSGFSVATINGALALLVGNSYGDILTLLYDGHGGFAPDRAGLDSTPLAVGMTSDGQEFAVVADQKLDTAYLYYRIAGTNHFSDPVPINSQLLLAPGAAQTFTVPGDSNPYLVVADSLSNEVLLYHYDPAKGFVLQGSPIQVGDDPVSVTVAFIDAGNVPDLIVANKGSNDVSVLIGNTTAGYWAAAPYQRLQSGGLGPVSVAVQDDGGSNGPNLLVTNGDGTVTTLMGIGANGQGSGFFQDGNPQPMQTTKTITGTVYDPRSDQTFAMAADGTVSVLTNGVLTPLPLSGVTTLYAVDSPTGGSFLVAGFDNGTVELLSADGSLIAGESTVFSAAPGALEVLQNGNSIDVFVTVAGSDAPDVVTFNLSGVATPEDGNGGGPLISLATTTVSSTETASATSVAGFDLVLVATLLPGELTENLTATVTVGPDAATFAVFLEPDGAGGADVVQDTDADAEPVDVAPTDAAATTGGTTAGYSPDAVPLENYLLGVSDALEQRLQDKQLKDGVEDFMDALKATLDQLLRDLPASPQEAPPPKDVPKPTNATLAGDAAPEIAAFKFRPVEARTVSAAAADADVFLSADLPAVAASRWKPENDGPAWSAADLRPALLAACMAWRIETDGQWAEQDERRRRVYRLE
jgi:FG-GAP-like repeat